MLKAIDLVKRYQTGLNPLEVLKGINLTIGKNEILGITGPSGAGKSTLLHILGGLDEPTKGRVNFEGKDISAFSSKAKAEFRNKCFGFVFQFYHLFSEFNALENVMLPALVRNEEKRSVIKEKAQKLLGVCGLKDRIGHCPSELSGGEQQRVAIARALINTPRILFCDEPTGNLDVKTGGQIKNLLWQLNKEKEMTLIMVTHSQELVSGATRVVHLEDGRIV